VRALKELFQVVALAAVFFFLLHGSFQTFRVSGSSMEPSLHNREYLLVNKAVYFRASWLRPFRERGYLFHPPRRGEIVILVPPRFGSGDYVKRVIGLPGEIVEIKNGKVFINGRPLEEPYIKEPPRYVMPPTFIPPGHYFVLGDNRNASTDSHNWRLIGPIPEENIIGKAWLSYWPPRHWGRVPNHPFER